MTDKPEQEQGHTEREQESTILIHIEQLWAMAEMRAAREMAEMAQVQQILRVDKAD
jgi:hypothetical protein